MPTGTGLVHVTGGVEDPAAQNNITIDEAEPSGGVDGDIWLKPSEGGSGSGNFVDLGDVPLSYVDQAGKRVAVKGDELGLEFVAPIDHFVDLADAPSAFTGAGGKTVRVKNDVSGLEFAAPIDHFIDLGDVPASFAGAGGKVVKVKGDASGLEFVAGGGGGGDFLVCQVFS